MKIAILGGDAQLAKAVAAALEKRHPDGKIPSSGVVKLIPSEADTFATLPAPEKIQ